MLSQRSFSKEHISSLFQDSRKDPQLIERTVFAFGLLDALASTGLSFIFKGGTCLILLLDHPMRLSTDIDILVEPGTYINTISDEVEYNENKYSAFEIMNDTFDSAACIASRGLLHSSDYRSYVGGCASLSAHIFLEKFTMQIAGYRAARIMYLVSRLLKDKPYIPLTDSQLQDLLHCNDLDLKPFKYMKKLDVESFCYAVKAIIE